MENVTYLYEVNVRDLKAKKAQYICIPLVDESKKGTIEMVTTEGRKAVWFFTPKNMTKVKWFKDCLKKLSKEPINAIAFQKLLSNVDMTEYVWQQYEQLLLDFAESNPDVNVLICSVFEKEDDKSVSLPSDDSLSGSLSSGCESEEEETEEDEYDEEDSFIASTDEEDDFSGSELSDSGTFSEISDCSTEETDSEEGLDAAFLFEMLQEALKRLDGLGVKTHLCKWCGKWEDAKDKDIIEEECSKCRDADHALSSLSEDDSLSGSLSDHSDSSDTSTEISVKSKAKSKNAKPETASPKKAKVKSPKVWSHAQDSIGDYIHDELVPRLKKDGSEWAEWFDRMGEDGFYNRLHVNKLETSAVFPPLPMVFNAFTTGKCIRPKDIKVVIIGQDPYPTPGAAIGLAFSHTDAYDKVQPSLKNIQKELKSDGFKCDDKSGDLTKWAEQGVFLINTALTVQEGKPGSHTKLWKDFTIQLFNELDNQPHLVIIMWGADAQKLGKKSFDTDKHKFIKSSHPSPMSANAKTADFFGSKPFTKANSYLKKWNLTEIDWNLV